MEKYKFSEDKKVTAYNLEGRMNGVLLSGIAFIIEHCDLKVEMHSPFESSKSVHMPYFMRGRYPNGFNGEYGRKRAVELLEELYRSGQ